MEPNATLVWTQYGLCVLAIGIAGVKLTDYGDSIADKTGMGGSWVGLVLIATVTSLPELAAGITASTVALLPDIAAGDVYGSCVYNLVLLAVLDLFSRRGPILARVQRQHVMTAGFGILLISISGLALLAAEAGLSTLAGHLSWGTPVIVLVYAVAIRTLHGYREDVVEEFTEQEPDRYAERSLKWVAKRYGIAAAVVVAAGVALPYVSEDLAVVMVWNQSFTGTLFTALSTSLPELVVTLAALRIGAVDMAAGNVLGSNMFNILVLAVDDLVYTQGSFYADISSTHLVSAFTAVAMTGIVITGIYFRPRIRVLGIGSWASLALITLFALNTWLTYHLGGTGH
ncbi:sodium:calcium antiporter [uncultured Thiohalocapsa sp.]|uniref:sodium:calcium antiporter n=1 Tax=uncultured Thiohalocapsa sp. TaxID=768990 RepID=UPI0025DCE04D|nr:sodium:calcium antiporter [uncultured Thiohalocapsa sp.]